jgi:3-methyl-2-oxobutanoate hydroxymethyltransferase
MVIQGHETTLPVTLDEVIYHCRAVARGAARPHLVGDMPFMSYQVSVEQALLSCGRMIKEGGAHAVKLEGGEEVAAQVRALVRAGIPVMGHVGLQPQSVHAMGGFKVQGRSAAAAARIERDAHALVDAGAYAIVLEGIPADLATRITRSIEVPTIGIGAGPDCDGQVLVLYDLLGMNDGFKPKFLKRYECFAQRIRSACAEYADEVQRGLFPTAEHSFAASLASAASGSGEKGAVGEKGTAGEKGAAEEKPYGTVALAK